MVSERDVLLAAAVFVLALVSHSEFLQLILCSLCYFYWVACRLFSKSIQLLFLSHTWLSGCTSWWVWSCMKVIIPHYYEDALPITHWISTAVGVLYPPMQCSLCVCLYTIRNVPLAHYVVMCFDGVRWGYSRRRRGSAALSALHGVHPGARRRKHETWVRRVCDCRSVGDDCRTLPANRVRQPSSGHDEL